MDLNEYQNLAQRTSGFGHDRIKNGCMGLIGESGEIVDIMKKYMFQSKPDTPLPVDKLIDEMGDVMWYIAEIITGMGCTLEVVHDCPGKKQFKPGIELFELAANMSVNAACVYLRFYVINEDIKSKISILFYLGDIYNILCEMCNRFGVTPRYIMSRNIEKLRKRYPDGFDPERSMNRPEYREEQQTESSPGFLFTERNQTI